LGIICFTCKALSFLRKGAFKLLNHEHGRPGQLFTALARWACLLCGVGALALLWDHPRTRPVPALAVGVGYAAFSLANALLKRRFPRLRALRVLHGLVDALAIGLAAWFSGAMESPIWLLFYLHVAAVSVRGGLGYALAMGALDASLVGLMAAFSQGDSLVGF